MGRRKVLRADCYFSVDDGGVPDGDPEFPNETVSSVDVGTVNFAAARVTLVVEPGTDGEKWRVLLRDACALTLKNNDPRAPIEDIVANLFVKMNSPKMAWFWDDETVRKMYVERQVDHIQGVAARDKHPGKATMHAVYAALCMLERARRAPTVCLSGSRLEALRIPDGEVIKDLERPSRFVPVSGHKKAGLRGVHGDARKQKTGDIAEQMLQDEDQCDMLEWFNSLARHKPREDVADAYLQARRELEDFHQQRLKEKRKRIRAEKKKAREDAAAARKRARDETGSTKGRRAKKRRTEDPIVIV